MERMVSMLPYQQRASFSFIASLRNLHTSIILSSFIRRGIGAYYYRQYGK